MARRLELHDELCKILGTNSVYYQPPPSLIMNYPCIVYHLAGINKRNANDRVYKLNKRYEVTVIDRDPDSEIADRIIEHFPMCAFDRSFTSDNLNHWVLTLYY